MYEQNIDFPSNLRELEKWYDDRIFLFENFLKIVIGKDSNEKNAIGIYKDGDDYTIYRNYKGKKYIILRENDEAVVVETFYNMLKKKVIYQENSYLEKIKRLFHEKLSIIEKIKLLFYNI